MGRRARIDVEGGWHHVMNRGAGRQRTFFTRSDGREFERLLGAGHDRFGVEVHAYCLMPNHFHLLVHCPRGDLGSFVQQLTGNYTRFVNDRLDRDGALFRGRYHALTVSDEQYVLAATRYIHRNPLANASTAEARRYRWSSHGVYLGDRGRPPWLSTNHVRQLLSGGLEAFDDLVFGDSRGAVPAHEQLLDQIGLIVGEVDPSTVARGPAVNRTIAHAVLDAVDARSRRQLVGELGLDEGARRRASRRARERVNSDPDLFEIAKEVMRRVA